MTVVELTERLEARHPGLLADAPIGEYVAELAGDRLLAQYNHPPAPVLARSAQIEERYGQDGLAEYHKLLLATLIETLPTRLGAARIPVSVQELVLATAERILRELDRHPALFYSWLSDRFTKDLGTCRLRLVPAGPELVALNGGFPRRLLVSRPRRKVLARLAAVYGRLGGALPLFETHLDRRLMREFSEEGYERFYRRLAEMLELRPDVRGVFFGAAWLLDPAVAKISPQLAFLQHPVRRGAVLVEVAATPDDARLATSTSSVRKELYEEGAYRPRRFLMLWPRKSLLASVT